MASDEGKYAVSKKINFGLISLIWSCKDDELGTTERFSILKMDNLFITFSWPPTTSY